MKINFPEECQKHIDLQCNGERWLYEEFPEHKHLDKYLKKINPSIALDIGCGIGRASVFFHKKYNWDCDYILFDGNSGDKQLDEIRKGKKDFYNSREATEKFAEANGIDYYFLDAELEWKSRLNDIILEIGNEQIDLAYSFLAFLFHWPISYIIDDIYPYLKKGAFLMFGTRGIENEKWVMKQVKSIDQTKYKILELVLKPKSTYESLLVLEKK